MPLQQWPEAQEALRGWTIQEREVAGVRCRIVLVPVEEGEVLPMGIHLDSPWARYSRCLKTAWRRWLQPSARRYAATTLKPRCNDPQSNCGPILTTWYAEPTVPKAGQRTRTFPKLLLSSPAPS